MLFKSHKSIRWLLTATVLFMMHTTAYAQATRTWISGVGDDVNPCSRTAPCKTWPGAISKTAMGGEIDALDPGSFGAVTVTKSITLVSDDSKNGGILTAGTNAITVNCTVDPNCTVVIRGISLNGGPIGSNSLAGIKFYAGGALHVEKCHISNFTGSSPYGYGIDFEPSTGTSRLYVSDSTINGNGAGTSGGGINVAPTGTGKAYAVIKNTQLSNNGGFGVFAGDNAFVQVYDTNISGNRMSGAVALSVMGFADIVLDGSTLNDDGWEQSTPQGAIFSAGANSYIHLSNDVISNNVYGIRHFSNGHVLSYGNNRIEGNTTDGTTTGTQTQL